MAVLGVTRPVPRPGAQPAFSAEPMTALAPRFAFTPQISHAAALVPSQAASWAPVAQLPPALQLPAVPPLLPVPVGTQAVIGGERVTMPVQPATLTAHLPDPEMVNRQKEQNFREVDEHLQQAQLLLEEQTRKEKDFLRAQAVQAKEISSGRWDQHLRAQEIAAEREYQQALAHVHESARQMRLKLEEQSSQLQLEYQTRRTQEEINRHKHEVELHHWEGQQRAGLRVRSLEDQIFQQQELQKQLALRHSQAAKRGVTGLPELPLARWEAPPAPVPLGASPYPMALPSPDPYLLSHAARSSDRY
eukprot:TRINITY_DN88383_c0_g1_i1.p1 TRINITY_DN88383_c0_g1~~TRINITY_DN88383_c0_g1_i1.p1  ORF type:complete len:313 (+),score=52.59 TRINITY_DN88383_c0_g1_i1:30-941(+)